MKHRIIILETRVVLMKHIKQHMEHSNATYETLHCNINMLYRNITRQHINVTYETKHM
jgi:hypothetical protein